MELMPIVLRNTSVAEHCGTPRDLKPAALLDKPAILKHADGIGAVNAPDLIDIRAGDRLEIRNDGKRLERGLREHRRLSLLQSLGYIRRVLRSGAHLQLILKAEDAHTAGIGAVILLKLCRGALYIMFVNAEDQ